jgi:hypothetical protein
MDAILKQTKKANQLDMKEKKIERHISNDLMFLEP